MLIVEKMRIYTDTNGVFTDAFSVVIDGKEVSGRVYQIVAGGNIAQIAFHEGPIKDGLNGITTKPLLALLIHHTKSLNEKFPCDENETAITHLEAALEAFESRTKDRQDRGVEGEHKA